MQARIKEADGWGRSACPVAAIYCTKDSLFDFRELPASLRQHACPWTVIAHNDIVICNYCQLLAKIAHAGFSAGKIPKQPQRALKLYSDIIKATLRYPLHTFGVSVVDTIYSN